jgi:superfamily I DNA/RNA helicase
MSDPSTEPVTPVEPVVPPAAAPDDSASTIGTLDDALKVITQLRNENASKRVKSKELEEKAQKWEEYVQSQKTELERLTESKTALEKENATLKLSQVRDRVAAEEKVPPELVEFVTGADEQEMRDKAKKLAGVAPTGSTTTAVTKTTDFFAGRRGAPVAESAEGLNSFFEKLWRDSNETSKQTFTS